MRKLIIAKPVILFPVPYSFSNRTAQAILNSLFGKTSNFGALASAPTIYVALSSTTPAEDGTNVTEPSGGSYARVATAPADWNAATLADPAVVTNANPITFPTASANWLASANITHFALYDALTVGNFLGFGALTVPKPVLSGDTPSYAAGALSVTLD
jgi:hypothetical protein